MLRYSISLPLLLLFSGLLWASKALPLVDHDITVKIGPGTNSIQVEDAISLPEPVESFVFILHADLNPSTVTEGARLEPVGNYAGIVPSRAYRVLFEQPQASLKLSYAGRIQHPVESSGQNQTRSRAAGTPGHISEQGVFLSASSLWYPLIQNRMLSFSLRVSLPDGWSSISQGVAFADGTGWRESSPQDEIYLIAGRYTVYKDAASPIQAQVYLRRPDPELAERYLQTTGYYLDLYQRLIGPYPYQKFAMVENFWESGYGMPSFTLLGPRVLRFPFILHSSYPHEILHNWWGNGVYVDYQKGNWSEGLTSYLADHLIKEQRGGGASYRRDTLQRYADFVHDGDDFPLIEFRGRHGDVSQAVGYGKTVMFFHMLRMQLGDKIFNEGLRRFYRDNLHRIAEFEDLRYAFEASSKQDLRSLFEQWITTTGAPDLQVSEIDVELDGQGYHIRGVLQQKQSGQVFDINVPIAIQTEAENATIVHLPMNQRTLRFNIALGQRPLRLIVDPGFDLFRRLADGETPSSLSQLFGAERITLVLPSSASDQIKQSLQMLATAWSGRWKHSEIVWDDTVKALPDVGGVILLGTANRFAQLLLDQLAQQQVSLVDQMLTIGDKSFSSSEVSFALTAAHPSDKSSALGLFSIGSIPATDGFARKLPHYGKYSYTVFQGNEPNNILKGQWDTSASTLSVNLTDGGRLPPAKIPVHKSLADLPGS